METQYTSLIAKVGGRKNAGFFTLAVLGFVALCFSMVSGTEWVTLNIALYGIYFK